MQVPRPINTADYARIVVLTGAGVSVASGLPTFRGPGGVWQDDVSWLSDAANLPDSLPSLWKFYGGRRGEVLAAQPNAAHFAIAKLQQQRQDMNTITLATQNVDGLHQRAGSRDVLELHGSIFRSRCTNSECSLLPFADEEVPEGIPLCPVCRSVLRPDIVLFGEPLPIDEQWRAKRALRDCDLFIAVGTSGTVSPASNFVRSAAYAGARTILINLTPMEPRHPDFHEEYLGRAEELLPALLNPL
jgi:NAD-dependent deacetylase